MVGSALNSELLHDHIDPGEPVMQRHAARAAVKEYLPKIEDALRTVRGYANNFNEEYWELRNLSKHFHISSRVCARWTSVASW